MIAEIDFAKDMVLTRKEANVLSLVHKEAIRLGIKDDEIVEMGINSYYHIKGEDATLVEADDGDDSSDSWVDPKGEIISSYYVYDKLPEKLSKKDFVVVAKNQLVDLFTFATKCKYKYSINRSVVDSETVSNLPLVLKAVEEKIHEFTQLVESIDCVDFNQKCNVHVGGGLIVTYNDIMLMDNSCTDDLQVKLNDGWRIIACCIQPNQRRPDYVLGRFNPELDTTQDTSAKRGK